jgi:hypothetical protein
VVIVSAFKLTDVQIDEATTPLKRFRVLYLGPYANPHGVGEAGSTFGWLRHLSDHVDGVVLTFCDAWHAVKEQLARPGFEVVGWPELGVCRRLGPINRGAKPGLVVFSRKVREWLRGVGAGHEFDFVHQLAPLNLRYACPVRNIVPGKLVVGPVAGSLPAPAGLAVAVREPWWMRLRRLDGLRMRCDRRLRETFAQADLVLGAAAYVSDLLPPERRGRFEVMSEVGLDSLPDVSAGSTRVGAASRLLFVGRLVCTKGIYELLEAMAKLPVASRAALDVVGDGPERPRVESRIVELELRDRVTLHGRLPRSRVDDFYRTADIFVFPSFREPSGNVVIEAMSWGLPLVVADYGGPAAVVDDSCGVRVPVHQHREGFISVLATAIQSLIDAPAKRAEMGANARRRIASDFLWTQKARRMLQWYEELLGGSGPMAPPTAMM